MCLISRKDIPNHILVFNKAMQLFCMQDLLIKLIQF